MPYINTALRPRHKFLCAVDGLETFRDCQWSVPPHMGHLISMLPSGITSAEVERLSASAQGEPAQRQDLCVHTLMAAVVFCTRPVQEQASQHSCMKVRRDS